MWTSVKSKKRNEARFSFCVLPEQGMVLLCGKLITWLLLFPLQRHGTSSSSSSSSPQQVTQVNTVSSSTDSLGKCGRVLAPPLHSGLQGPLPFNITSPCLERLLQAKESIVNPYVAGGCNSRAVAAVREDPWWANQNPCGVCSFVFQKKTKKTPEWTASICSDNQNEKIIVFLLVTNWKIVTWSFFFFFFKYYSYLFCAH